MVLRCSKLVTAQAGLKQTAQEAKVGTGRDTQNDHRLPGAVPVVVGQLVETPQRESHQQNTGPIDSRNRPQSRSRNRSRHHPPMKLG